MSKFPSPEDDDNPFIHPAHVRERDIDLLLFEELYASDKFQTHFIGLLRRSCQKPVPKFSKRFEEAVGLATPARNVSGLDASAAVLQTLPFLCSSGFHLDASNMNVGR